MPRTARRWVPGAVHQIIARFVNREYRMGDQERQFYLSQVPMALRHTDWRPISYALMTTHVHWAFVAGRCSPDVFVRSLHTTFGIWYNTRHDKLGHVFAGRYSLFLQSNPAKVIAYQHNNPVRAGVVSHAANSRWTSHRAYLGFMPAPPWLDVVEGLSRCGLSPAGEGRIAFDELVESLAGDERDGRYCEIRRLERRRRIRELVGGPVELAAPSVGEANVVMREPIVGWPNMALRPRWNGEVLTALQEVERFTGVSVDVLRSSARTRSIVRARRLALATWTRCLGRRQAEMAPVLGLTESAASQLLAPAAVAAVAKDAETVAAVCWAGVTGGPVIFRTADSADDEGVDRNIS